MKKPYKLINTHISNHLTNDDKMEIEKEINHWYGRNDESFLDVTVSKYADESNVIKLSHERWQLEYFGYYGHLW